MPPRKRGGAAKKATKASPRAKKVEDEEMEEEVVQQEESQEEVVQQEASQEEPDDSLNDSEINGQMKRKADDDDDEDDDETAAKKQKTEDDDDDDDQEEEEIPDKVSLFCGNLDPELTADTLKGFFEANGIEVLDARKSERKRFGYIDVEPMFEEEVLAMNGKELNGSEIRIDKAKPKGVVDAEKQPSSNPRDDKTLFVKNLTENVTEDMLKDFFSPAEVEEIRLPKKRDGLCKGFGYVVFDSIDTMEEQLKEKQGAELEGQQIFLDYTNDKSSHISMAKKGLRGFSPSKVIFVRNLSFDVSEEELKENFPGCQAARIPTNPNNDKPKGFAFVEFESVEDAVAAQKEKDGIEINGRTVQLAFATDKQTGGGGGGGGGGGFGRRGGGGGGWGGGGGGGRWGGGGGGGWGGGGGGGRWGGGGGGWGGGGRGGGGGGKWGGGGGGGWGGGGGGWGGGGGRGGGRGGRGGGRGGGFKKRW